MQLTLFVPQLFWPEPEDQIALQGLAPKGLNTLLARARLSRRAARPHETALAELFGFNANAPFAALRLAGELLQPAAPDACWLCADPVHLRMHQQRIVLADATAFALSMEEAQHLARDLNLHFAELGQFHVAHPQRWYLRLNQELGADHDTSAAIPPLSAIAGRRVDGNLPESPLAAQLKRWQNEVQMYLHQHPVNTTRNASGHPAINSLWFWGPGRLPVAQPVPFDEIWAESPLASGLARLSQRKVHGRAASLNAILQHAAPRKHVLVVLDELALPAQHDDGSRWRSLLAELDHNWFAPLLQASRVHRLDLVSPTQFGILHWTLNSGDRWKVWRRPQVLQRRIQSLAKESFA